MNGLINIAGNDVSIFLFRFNLSGNGIEFILNEAIAEDMYEDLDKKIKPLAHACCETLLRYKALSISDTIMDCCVLDTGELEVMLSKGLGRYFIESEKENLFQDAKKISDLLDEVMSRRTEELKAGKKQAPQPINYPMNPDVIKKALSRTALHGVFQFLLISTLNS